MNTISNTPAQTFNNPPSDTTVKQGSLHHTARPQSPAPSEKASKSFEATMADITRPMSTPKRLFSKLIHIRWVDSVSDILGNTVVRPNALLSGAFFSFTLTLVAYLFAKNLGYNLSGFESIGSFIFGWLLGLIYDFLKVMITGKR